MNQGFKKITCPKCKGIGEIRKIIVRKGKIYYTDKIKTCTQCGGAKEINNLEDRMFRTFVINCYCGHEFKEKLRIETAIDEIPILDKGEEVKCPKCSRIILAYVNGKLDYRFKLE